MSTFILKLHHVNIQIKVVSCKHLDHSCVIPTSVTRLRYNLHIEWPIQAYLLST